MPIVTSTDPSQHQVLDPGLLGRPVHLLPQFARRLGEDLSGAMQAPVARRYWGPFQLDAIAFVRAPDEIAARWLGIATEYGSVAVAFERPLLLGLLDCRYGARGSAPAAAADASAVRITATEERLAVTLTQQLADVLAARVGANLNAAGLPAAAVEGLAPALPVGAPAKSTWTIQVALRAPQSGHSGQFWMALDQPLMTDILRGLQPEKLRPHVARSAAEPLVTRLQVKLEGRLVSKEITLANLFDLQIGDVIPVAVGRADVLLDESRLFTAAVAEHKGKLCLTSFEDAE
jgi:flagellar motor switch protein FliM